MLYNVFCIILYVLGLTKPFPRFLSLNQNTPDLSIPDLDARIQNEQVSLKGIICTTCSIYLF